jgi:hypothetical protein
MLEVSVALQRCRDSNKLLKLAKLNEGAPKRTSGISIKEFPHYGAEPSKLISLRGNP